MSYIVFVPVLEETCNVQDMCTHLMSAWCEHFADSVILLSYISDLGVALLSCNYTCDTIKYYN